MNHRNEIHELLGVHEPGLGGITQVSMSAEQVTQILEWEPQLKEETQNHSPSMEEFVKLARKYNGSILDGYVVFPPRTDERVSIEAIRVPWDSLTKENLYEFACMSADEFDRDGDYLRLWWD